MIKVWYKNSTWDAKFSLRESMYEDYRHMYPDTMIEISKSGTRDLVPIRGLLLYSLWRNGYYDRIIF